MMTSKIGHKMKCSICNGEVERKFWNQQYCSQDCRNIRKKNCYEELNEDRECDLCGFKEIVNRHHIIKKIDFGSDKEENVVDLCPNHHKMSDHPKYEEEMKKKIYEKTGKKGSCLSEKSIQNVKDYIKKYFYVLRENEWGFYYALRQLIQGNIFYRIASEEKIT